MRFSISDCMVLLIAPISFSFVPIRHKDNTNAQEGKEKNGKFFSDIEDFTGNFFNRIEVFSVPLVFLI